MYAIRSYYASCALECSFKKEYRYQIGDEQCRDHRPENNPACFRRPENTYRQVGCQVDKRKAERAPCGLQPVITSYSIHYTKLYEAGRAGRDRRDAECILVFDEQDIEKQFQLSAMSRLTRRDVITSYSIHYTKLYDVAGQLRHAAQLHVLANLGDSVGQHFAGRLAASIRACSEVYPGFAYNINPSPANATGDIV